MFWHSLSLFLCHMYLTKLSVYDKNDHGFFVLLGDAGRELTGKPASELVERYFEVIVNMSSIQLTKCILIRFFINDRPMKA